MSLTESVSLTGVNDIDGLLAGMRWGEPTVSFSFPAWDGVTTTGLKAAQQAVGREVLGMVSSFTNLSFNEVSGDSGELRFGLRSQNPGTWAYAYYPGSGVGGDSFYNNNGSLDDPIPGGHPFRVFMHEIGHALGLKHSHESGAFPPLSTAHDSSYYSVMSYNVPAASQTFMMCDIAALQYLYGADFTYNGGNSTYRWDPATGTMSNNGAAGAQPLYNQICMTVWDGGGTDTYDLSNYTTSVRIDLRPGEWTLTSASQLASSGGPGNICNALLYNGDTRSLIENAIGGIANDILIGNSAANRLTGGAGADQMTGGAGNDTYDVNSAGDVVTENLAEGTDTVLSAINHVLAANVENLTLVGTALNGTGNDLTNAVVGNALANVLAGAPATIR